jgi:uncharacterized protein
LCLKKMTTSEKLKSLRALLADARSAVIALSGGTDSTFLTYTAAGIKGLRLIAVTVNTPYMFASEVKEAKAFCNETGVEHREISIDIPDPITNNPPDRCYLCKKEVMSAIAGIAAKEELAYIFDGTNADDLHEYRPGIQALRETGVRSPLAETGLTKDEIRELARKAGLEVSDRPSNTCLLTRFPHDAIVTPVELSRAGEAENYITSLGFRGSRVRIHGDLVRIEWREEHFEAMMKAETRRRITSALKAMGYRYITFDAEGYRSGSMDNK